MKFQKYRLITTLLVDGEDPVVKEAEFMVTSRSKILSILSRSVALPSHVFYKLNKQSFAEYDCGDHIIRYQLDKVE